MIHIFLSISGIIIGLILVHALFSLLIQKWVLQRLPKTIQPHVSSWLMTFVWIALLFLLLNPTWLPTKYRFTDTNFFYCLLFFTYLSAQNLLYSGIYYLAHILAWKPIKHFTLLLIVGLSGFLLIYELSTVFHWLHHNDNSMNHLTKLWDQLLFDPVNDQAFVGNWFKALLTVNVTIGGYYAFVVWKITRSKQPYLIQANWQWGLKHAFILVLILGIIELLPSCQILNYLHNTWHC